MDGEHWASDGALWGTAGAIGAAAMYGSDGDGAGMDAVKEVIPLAAAVAGVSFGLNAIASYNHERAKGDPNVKDASKVGMPHVGPLGVDTVTAIVGISLAAFAGDALGELGQTIALGAGLAGLAVTSGSYGAAAGVKAATKGYEQIGAATGRHALGHGDIEGLSPEGQRVYNQFVGV